MATVRLARRAFIKCVYLCCGARAQDAATPVVVDAEHEAPVALMGGVVDMNDLRAYVDAVPCLSMLSGHLRISATAFLCADRQHSQRRVCRPYHANPSG